MMVVLAESECTHSLDWVDASKRICSKHQSGTRAM